MSIYTFENLKQNNENLPMKLAVELGKRLRLERIRLGLRQEDIAHFCRTTMRTVIAWESGSKFPAHWLTILSKKGFDINYVVIGERSAFTEWGSSICEALRDKIVDVNLLQLICSLRKHDVEKVTMFVNMLHENCELKKLKDSIEQEKE